MIPAEYIDGNRRLSLSLIVADDGTDTPWRIEHFPRVVSVNLLLPHIVPWPLQDDPPTEWLRDNVGGCWLQWAGGIYFNDPRDAFAFKMRWI